LSDIRSSQEKHSIDASAHRRSTSVLALFRSPAWLGMTPLCLILIIFLLLPIFGMAMVAFSVTGSDGSTHFGLQNFASLKAEVSAVYNSLLVSFIGSFIAAVVGTLCSFCIARINNRILNAVVAVFSSVLANDGGAPLAFSFIVTLGSTGVIYGTLGLGHLGFSLYSWQGLIVMYQYFLIPTMVMVTLPTFAGLRKEWREANTALGGSTFNFWCRVGIPIAFPALLGGWVLLFGAAFATYASSAVLIGAGGYPLVPLSIASLLSSGIGPGGQSTAMALGLAMVLVAVIVLFLFNRLQKRSAQWLQ